MIDVVFSQYHTKYDLRKVERFLKEYSNGLGVAQGSFKEVVEKIHTNIRWMDKNYASVIEWLSVSVQKSS
jgi:hypothetical protein